MLSYTDLTKGVLFVVDGEPWEVLESHFLRMQQRKAVVQTKIRNLITGKLLDRNYQASDTFEEAEIERKHALFIYESKGQYWFHEEGNPKTRFALEKDVVGDTARDRSRIQPWFAQRFEVRRAEVDGFLERGAAGRLIAREPRCACDETPTL